MLEADGMQVRYLMCDGPPTTTWLVFHGFGQRPADWVQAAGRLAKLGRVFWIELPGHGKLASGKTALLTPSIWEHWLQALCRKERIPSFKVLGYSLGGKLALASALVMPNRVQEVVLCAAEGATPHFWYSLATGRRLGRLLLNTLVEKPAPFFIAIRLFNKLGLINKSEAKFAESHLKTPAQRNLVAQSWISLRLLPGTQYAVAECLNQNQIPLRMFAGQHDKVVPARRMAPLGAKVEGAQLIMLDTGHNQLPAKAIDYMLAEAMELDF
jgi:pimeloyl-ACP methyl ester carboxylesterase